MERHEEQLDAWVSERMTGRPSLPAEWPDDRDGWRRLEQRLALPRLAVSRLTRSRLTLSRLTPRRRAWVWAAAAMVAVAAVIALPAARTAAQRLWDEVFVGRFELLPTDFEHGAVAHLFSPEFRLRPEPIVALQAWLDQLQAHWNEQLQSFKRHVEAKERTT